MNTRQLFIGYLFVSLLHSSGECMPLENSDFFKGADASMGIELESNITGSMNMRANIQYPIFYSLPIYPVNLELDGYTLALQMDNGKARFSFLNMLWMPAAILPGLMGCTTKSFFGFGPAGFIFAIPQVATNFKFHYPIITDHVNAYIGEATDYFIYGKDSKVFTASKIGIKSMYGPVSFDIAVNKPWLKGYLENGNLYLNLTIGLILKEDAQDWMDDKIDKDTIRQNQAQNKRYRSFPLSLFAPLETLWRRNP